MFGFLRKVTPILIVSALALTCSAFSYVNFGGEIPWPLSIQHVVTVENSQGLWKLESKSQTRLFNVEMKRDAQSGFDWIRVSEINAETYKVLSWGEGFFSPSQLSNQPESSFSNISLETSPGKGDKLGRYITMYPNGDLTQHPYLIRMVEVESTLGNVLGLTIIEYSQKSLDHFLGARVMADPLSCSESEKVDNLTCYLNL